MDAENATLLIHPRPAADATEMGAAIGHPADMSPGDDRLVGAVAAALVHPCAPDQPGVNIARLTLGKAEGIATLILAQILFQQGQGGHAVARPQNADIGVGMMVHPHYPDELAAGFLQHHLIAAVGHMTRGNPNTAAIHRKSRTARRRLPVRDRHHNSRLAGQ